MKADASRATVLMAGAITLTWPMAIGWAALRFVFTDAYVAAEAFALAFPISALLTVLAVAVSVRQPPGEGVAWVFRCGVLGAILGDVWLALGAYVHARYDVSALTGTLLGGLLYGAPVGFVVGMTLGAEMAMLQRAASRMANPIIVVAILGANALGGILIWLATDRLGGSAS